MIKKICIVVLSVYIALSMVAAATVQSPQLASDGRISMCDMEPIEVSQ